jgi:hypothetical protein
MARAIICAPQQRAAGEPLYDFDPQTGATVEVFYADQVLANSFGTRRGWFWWTCRPGFLPDGPPRGPFASSYRAYRDWLTGLPPRQSVKGFLYEQYRLEKARNT